MALIEETQDVFDRPKFIKYFSREDARDFMASIRFLAQTIDINYKIKAARDPKDNKVLELASSGDADYIITGDQDLLVLKQYGITKIVSPTDLT